MTVIKFYDAREGALSSDRPLNVAEIRNRTMEFVLSPGKVRLCPTKPALFKSTVNPIFKRIYWVMNSKKRNEYGHKQ